MLAKPNLKHLAPQHIALSLKITLFGFVVNAGCLESVVSAMYGSSVWIYSSAGTLRLGIYVTQTLIGDAFMVNTSLFRLLRITTHETPPDIQTLTCMESQPKSHHPAHNLMPFLHR